MAESAAPFAFEFVQRGPSPQLAGTIIAMTGYRETAGGRFAQRQTAPLIVPLIISFGTPFLIALGREPEASDRQLSFAAGLYPGPVYIESDGGAACVQVTSPRSVPIACSAVPSPSSPGAWSRSTTCSAMTATGCASGLVPHRRGSAAST
ncbi:hypothetical protein [Bradyrhizobium ivorense]|uniref:hypothetical protein n=1 Tax=Bradyrhizobium ivorense TaxID=2511166 RepID=UPI0027E36453|nr:hypothetical protein [Bradyrhizobium ivorense]